LQGDHAEQVQGVGVLGLRGQYGLVEAVGLVEAAALVVPQGGA